MSLEFVIVGYGKSMPSIKRNTAYLSANNWDDYGFKTLFYLTVYDDEKEKIEIGNIKIGYKGQETGWTKEKLAETFYDLDDNFFSLGQDYEYYQNIYKKLSADMADNLLSALGDIASNEEIFYAINEEDVFKTSLLRDVSIGSIKDQFRRVLKGDSPLTKYHFSYSRAASKKKSEISLDFLVKPNSTPPSNIHVLIGRNGVGKTSLLNDIVASIIDNEADYDEVGTVYDCEHRFFTETQIDSEYFSSVISVSFSAFDPFMPPSDRADRSEGTCFFYIGLKNINTHEETIALKDHGQLRTDFKKSLDACFSLVKKKERWLKAIKKLESDTNFAQMKLHDLENYEGDELKSKAHRLFSRMSSGHAIVLLSITKLVETVEEKTLVLMDEPESHLHPPLLSAFIRALSDLLISRNGVAIIATHSPVVLQEVPKSCVWKLSRFGLSGKAERLENETFGENVGVLTREVFGLEVDKSGFHKLLTDAVDSGASYEEILEQYDYQIGYEGMAILRSLIAVREIEMGQDEL